MLFCSFLWKFRTKIIHVASKFFFIIIIFFKKGIKRFKSGSWFISIDSWFHGRVLFFGLHNGYTLEKSIFSFWILFLQIFSVSWAQLWILFLNDKMKTGHIKYFFSSLYCQKGEMHGVREDHAEKAQMIITLLDSS